MNLADPDDIDRNASPENDGSEPSNAEYVRLIADFGRIDNPLVRDSILRLIGQIAASGGRRINPSAKR